MSQFIFRMVFLFHENLFKNFNTAGAISQIHAGNHFQFWNWIALTHRHHRSWIRLYRQHQLREFPPFWTLGYSSTLINNKGWHGYFEGFDYKLVDGFIYKFADDTKYGRVVVHESDRIIMQDNINHLMRWAEIWQMEFNAKKCKLLHLGSSNPRYVYTMGGYAPAGTVLQSVSEEKDIGVLVHESLKPSSQCCKAAKKANSVLGQMARSFLYRDKYTWVRLYTTYVRPHMEFSVQSWSPWYVRDIDVLEKVQERAVNMVRGLRGRTYEAKLKELGLTTLAARRQRGDMIQVWKFINKESLMDPTTFSFIGTEQNGQSNQTTRHSTKPLNIIQTPKCRFEINLAIKHLNLYLLTVESAGCRVHLVEPHRQLFAWFTHDQQAKSVNRPAGG